MENHQIRPFVCSTCNKSFRKGNQFRQHLIIHLPIEERPYKCYLCGKGFNRSHHLKLHIMTHTNQVPYRCEVCNQGFKQQSTLRKHMTTHGMPSTHVCQGCDKTFLSLKVYQRHMDLKHGDDNNNALQCDICQKSFKNQANLDKHELTHMPDRPYLCVVCNATFASDTSLNQHMSVHKERKIFTCRVCSRAFIRFGNFQNHLVTHTGYIPHTCDICHKSFYQSGSFKRHMLSHGNAVLDVADNANIDVVSRINSDPVVIKKGNGGLYSMKSAADLLRDELSSDSLDHSDVLEFKVISETEFEEEQRDYSKPEQQLMEFVHFTDHNLSVTQPFVMEQSGNDEEVNFILPSGMETEIEKIGMKTEDDDIDSVLCEVDTDFYK